ncbi:MAG: hypothetical protein ACREAG_07950 [Nitrosopumilaceae archaeon]
MAQQPPQQPMPRDYEDMEFTIEGEDWNRYELKDGTTIRGRVILQKVIRDPYKPNNFSFKISPPMWSVYAPITSRSEPNIKAGERIVGAKYEAQINVNHEPWNVYRLVKTGQKLKIKLSVTEISRFVDKFDADGMPVYDVPSGVSIAVSPADTTKGQ